MRLKAKLLAPGYTPLPLSLLIRSMQSSFWLISKSISHLALANVYVGRSCSMDGDCSAVKPANRSGYIPLL